jgi:hypothetical protein
MPREPRYGVKFVGYSANVIARKNGRDVEYARLDFVSGAAFMRADGGWVTVPKPTDLKPFLESLPKPRTSFKRLPCANAMANHHSKPLACPSEELPTICSACSPRYGDQSLYPTTNQAIHRDRASTRTR